MKGRVGAFATLAAVGLLVLTAAVLAGSVLASQQIVVERGRAERSLGGQSAAWAVVDGLLAALQQTWNADEQSLPAWWSEHSAGFSAVTDLAALSGCVNLNSMTPFLLQNSELQATLKGRSVGEFTNYRLDKGPFPEKDSYKDYFQPTALKAMYCVQSLFNVNTADEIMLERVLTARTGDAAFAATVRSRVRQFRANRQMMAQSDLDTMLGGEADAVGGLLTVEPEIDVNAAPVEVLQAILRDTDLKVAQPDAKLQAVVAGRATRPWTSDALRQTLGVDKNSLVLQYLGTRTRFLQGTIHEETGDMTVVVLVDYSADSPPKIALRVLHTEWARS